MKSHNNSVVSNREVKMSKQEIIEKIERAGFEAVEMDMVYNRVVRLKSLILLIAVCSSLFAFGCGVVPNSSGERTEPRTLAGERSEPRVLAANEIPSVISKIPNYTRFSYSGLAFFKGRLYAATNVGILEVENAKPSKLYKWKDGDDVVSGPWLDVANGGLWAMHDGLGKLIHFDGTSWKLVNTPTPKAGYTRGDVLRGFKGIGLKDSFWFAGGGFAWRWNPRTASWSENISRGGSIEQELSVLDRELIAIAINERVDEYGVEQSVAANEQGFFCTDDGHILRVTSEGAKRIVSPGLCEAIAVSPAGVLVGSFKGLGLFELSKTWKKKFESPYGPTATEQWADLAVTDNEYAFSVTSKAVGFGDNTTYRGPTVLWVAVEGQLVPLTF